MNRSATFVPCEVSELGGLFAKLADNAETNWIEYVVQFDY